MTNPSTTEITVTTYAVGAYLDRDGQRLSMDQAEVLGEAHGVIYTDRDDAESAQSDCEGELSDTDLDPATQYVVESTEHTISIALDSVRRDDPEEVENYDPATALSHYIDVAIRIDGTRCRVSCVVGAPESDHGTVRASGSDVRPFCSAWWSDSSDHDRVPAWAVTAVLDLLIRHSFRLYTAACEVAS